MIKSKKELRFYIQADRIIRGLPPQKTIRERLSSIFAYGGGKILRFQRYMRIVSYYKSLERRNFIDYILWKLASLKFKRLSEDLGFSIGTDVFGYGLLIPHYGTIVVNEDVRVGNYCVLHTSTCIGGANKVIGDALYLSAGAKIMGNLTLGNGVSIAANSLVNKSFGDNILLTGMPGAVKKDNYPMWYERDGEIFSMRVQRIEDLKKKMGIV